MAHAALLQPVVGKYLKLVMLHCATLYEKLNMKFTPYVLFFFSSCDAGYFGMLCDLDANGAAGKWKVLWLVECYT